LLDPGQTCTAVQLQQRLADLTAGLELIKQAIQVRRQVADGPYLIDHLIRLCDDERRLNDSELVSLIAILAGEGLDTSRLLIANTVFNLLQQPAAMTLLQAYPALWPNAVKEVLRFDFPVKLGTPLYALEDYPIDGKVITRGERVYPVIAAAHRDPEIFHRPDEFDITRSMTAVLDGDLAAHTFIGLNLARVEAEVAAQRLFAALPELRMVAAPTYDAKHKTLRAMTALPLVFADGAAAGFCR
jgi:cytochrome P450